jgi:hypothetical protein
MKKMVFCVIPLIMILMGCASIETVVVETKDNSPGKYLNAAKKLAAGINAIKPGSAKVNGDTVTVTDKVELKAVLTVPEGVTLDLTAAGAALELRDGAALTVNGVVNASGHGDHGSGWVDGSLRVGDGAAVIAGSGTIRLTSKGRLLNIGSDKGRRQLTLDGVTLVGLDNDNPLVGIGENGGFVLKSGAITGNTYASDEWAGGGGVEVHKGTFTMEGGAISGNSANGKRGASGGGVSIGEESVFTMTGGAITGNTAREGGGVRVWQGTFTLEDGTISGNTAQGSIDSNNYGGGVYVGGEGGRFVMKGGAIKENTVTPGRHDQGGGVTVERGTFTMSGGEISGNSVKGRNGAIGGGVMIHEGTFTMSGGEITGNSIQGPSAKGGGVRVGEESVFTMSGGAIYGNNAQGSDHCFGGGVIIDASTFTMQGGRIQGGTDSDGFTKNSITGRTQAGVALSVDMYEGAVTTVKWGIGGAYTKGGVPQTGGSDIGSTNNTLIAVPGQ